ncbi:hypothetical protein CspHIS471_0101470 [Cutaneotrichosporon sp. HIS471]|nr:hypothetical protein CspHIS471_0101470 [Cutaneotrichosporon sp. HIS471]
MFPPWRDPQNWGVPWRNSTNWGLPHDSSTLSGLSTANPSSSSPVLMFENGWRTIPDDEHPYRGVLNAITEVQEDWVVRAIALMRLSGMEAQLHSRGTYEYLVHHFSASFPIVRRHTPSSLLSHFRDIKDMAEQDVTKYMKAKINDCLHTESEIKEGQDLSPKWSAEYSDVYDARNLKVKTFRHQAQVSSAAKERNATSSRRFSEGEIELGTRLVAREQLQGTIYVPTSVKLWKQILERYSDTHPWLLNHKFDSWSGNFASNKTARLKRLDELLEGGMDLDLLTNEERAKGVAREKLVEELLGEEK